MNQYEENKDYRIEGKVLGVNFSNSVYTNPKYNHDQIVDESAYFYAEGNYSCDCNKRLFADVGSLEDDGPCGGSIKYEELFLVYKDGTKIDLLTSPRFEDD